jgi:hypothetical protein
MKTYISNHILVKNRIFNKLTLIGIIFLSTILSNNSFAQKIAAGWSHSLYLCNNGNTVNAWGANAQGQLGDGTTTE